ncbi:hypothetical protein C8Q76DRAFT_801594 [Earliella scabrosa]|nr:hypothetical protein C8Q76DRAFT_801594 [Earliella scabrosa]
MLVDSNRPTDTPQTPPNTPVLLVRAPAHLAGMIDEHELWLSVKRPEMTIKPGLVVWIQPNTISARPAVIATVLEAHSVNGGWAVFNLEINTHRAKTLLGVPTGIGWSSPFTGATRTPPGDTVVPAHCESFWKLAISPLQLSRIAKQVGWLERVLTPWYRKSVIANLTRPRAITTNRDPSGLDGRQKQLEASSTPRPSFSSFANSTEVPGRTVESADEPPAVDAPARPSSELDAAKMWHNEEAGGETVAAEESEAESGAEPEGAMRAKAQALENRESDNLVLKQDETQVEDTLISSTHDADPVAAAGTVHVVGTLPRNILRPFSHRHAYSL